MTPSPLSVPTPLLAERFPLRGSRLIEASAGTGKTWTIAALYLRLVLGHGDDDTAFARPLAPAEILVMTFTRAATRELSDRIRQRLLTAASGFRGEQPLDPNDDFLATVMAAYPEGRSRRDAAWRLAMAAQGMDEASVLTIDAWCQRMLREHAFDSGSRFDEHLVADEAALLTEAARDYWRRECYPLPPETLDTVLKVWKDIPSLCHDVSELLRHGLPTHGAEAQQLQTRSLPELLQQLTAHLPPVHERVQRIQEMQTWLITEKQQRKTHWNGNKLRDSSIDSWFQRLLNWARQPAPLVLPGLDTGTVRLTPEGLRDARTKGAPDAFDIPAVFDWFATLVAHDQERSPFSQLRQHAALHVAERLALLKRQDRGFGFADLLERLDRALQGAHGERLRQRIRTQFPVALVDEFQDTSPLQYRLFEQIYGMAEPAPDRALMLIGDPKQSIYGFRGADIYSYLKARLATTGRHYVLMTNHRSSQPLVQAVNHCFEQAEQHIPQGAFHLSGPSGNPLPFVCVQARGRRERLVGPSDQGEAPLPALNLVYDPEWQTHDSLRHRFAERCAEQIVCWLNEPGTGFRDDTGGWQRLRPGDIAVLVRTGQEARLVRRALQRRSVASVYLSDKASVFHSDEARDLVHWLRGVAMPQSAPLVRAALAVGSLGRTLGDLAQLAHDDDRFDQHSQTLHELHLVWQRQGVLAMLRQTLHRFELGSRWLDQVADGERRLTNFMHLAELLQNASRDLEGEQALIRWLQAQIDDEQTQSDDRIMRLESDADLVQVITIHKSKGLEFPLVCLPFPVVYRPVERRHVRSLSLPDTPDARRLVLEPNDHDLEQADLERLREDLRLLYVAMTRPRHLLWMGFAPVKNGHHKTCQSHLSAIGYLLGQGQALSPEAWTERLTQFSQTLPDLMLEYAQAGTTCTPLNARDPLPPLEAAPRFDTAIGRDWTIASYSRLSGAIRDRQAMEHRLRRTHRLDDEQVATDEDSTERVPRAAVSPSDQTIAHAFARGPFAGSFLHEQLEWLAGRGFALGDEAPLRHTLLERLEQSEHRERAGELLDWLQQICTTPLPGPGVCLSQLPQARAEMEFWLPMDELDVPALDRLCHEHLLVGTERPALQSPQLRGMLMGFMDLVCEHEGRYWVLDHKSNHLGADDSAYAPDALAQAMARHRYDVQAALYLCALYRLLATRLGPDQDPCDHMGGAVFLFLRGIQHPDHGACVLRPGPDFYQQVDALFAQEEAGA